MNIFYAITLFKSTNFLPYRWADLSESTSPVAMVLNGVRFSSEPRKNLLIEPIIVAQVLRIPSVNENTGVLYNSALNELRIHGNGFIGSKAVTFYFNPPLVREVAYEDVTPYPLRDNEIILRLRHGYKWSENSGPLHVIGVDTGGGPVKVNGDMGVQVAYIRSNAAELPSGAPTLKVDGTAAAQLVYADEPNIVIYGDGFNPAGNNLRFSNGILGKGINYTTVSTFENSISIRLTQGSLWRKNFDNLPGPLTLLAINAGQGFLAVGSVGHRCDIATVFERPRVFPTDTKLFRTQTRELHIYGTGFPVPTSHLAPSPYKTQLKFSPPLNEGVDYQVKVINRFDLQVVLLEGRAWRSDAGPLMVTHVNTRGDDAGWVVLPGDGVRVANVEEDFILGAKVMNLFGSKVFRSAHSPNIKIMLQENCGRFLRTQQGCAQELYESYDGGPWKLMKQIP